MILIGTLHIYPGSGVTTFKVVPVSTTSMTNPSASTFNTLSNQAVGFPGTTAAGLATQLSPGGDGLAGDRCWRRTCFRSLPTPACRPSISTRVSAYNLADSARLDFPSLRPRSIRSIRRRRRPGPNAVAGFFEHQLLAVLHRQPTAAAVFAVTAVPEPGSIKRCAEAAYGHRRVRRYVGRCKRNSVVEPQGRSRVSRTGSRPDGRESAAHGGL